MLGKLYLYGGIVLLALCGVMILTGYELGGGRRDFIPADKRSQDGYRSFHIFHSGYRGGK
ncbi:MAG: hypothetical protein HY231_21575 [Acidobacteria bacterium]|nr:hypothetical protein [Acidobacteriota bacterium]